MVRVGLLVLVRCCCRMVMVGGFVLVLMLTFGFVVGLFLGDFFFV